MACSTPGVLDVEYLVTRPRYESLVIGYLLYDVTISHTKIHDVNFACLVNITDLFSILSKTWDLKRCTSNKKVRRQKLRLRNNINKRHVVHASKTRLKITQLEKVCFIKVNELELTLIELF